MVSGVGNNNRYPETGPGSREAEADAAAAREEQKRGTDTAKSEEGFKNPLLDVGRLTPSHAGRPVIAQFNAPENGKASVTLTGDPRVLIALLMAKDAEESLDPLNETAKKLQSASDKREAIRALKAELNKAASSSETGTEATLSVSELQPIIDKARALGVDVTPLENLVTLAQSSAGADNPQQAGDRIIGIEFPDDPALHQARTGMADKGRTAFDDASEASRDSQTSINFTIQLQMQNHTNLYTTASQTLAELKRQNGAVSIS